MQLADPNYPGGANVPSLSEARRNYLEFGAIEERFRGYVRLPRPDEMSIASS